MARRKRMHLTYVALRGAAQISRLIASGLALALMTYLMTIGIRAEVPTGGIRGAVLMAESSTPLTGAEVVLHPQFTLPDWPGSRMTAKTGDDGTFTFRNLPVGFYVVEAYGKAHTMEGTRVEVTEGGQLQLQLALKPQPPRLELYVSQHIYAPGEEPSLQVDGFGQERTVHLVAYRIDFDALVGRGGLESFIAQEFRWDDQWTKRTLQRFSPDLTAQVTLDHEIVARDIEGQFVETVKLPALPEGLYFLSGTYHGREVGSWLAVSEIALVTKQWGSSMLAFVTRIDTGAPVAGAEVAVGSTRMGTTGPDGLLEFALPGDMHSESGQAVVHAAAGGSRALVSFYQGGFGEERPSDLRLFLYTERPVYRPGHEVHYKGIARRLIGSDYQLPAPGGTVEIEVRDPDDNLLTTGELTLTGAGTFHGSFTLNEEAATGPYQLIARTGGAELSTYVDVAAYRKPEYTVTVAAAKPFFTRGEVAEAVVESQYYFGGPVAGAQVEVYIYRTPLWADAFTAGEMAEWGYEYDYGHGGGEFIKRIEAVTDGRGRAVIRFDTTEKKRDRDERDRERYWWDEGATDFLYRIEASVSDPGGKWYSGTGTVKVVRGAFSLRVDTSRYVSAPREAVEITLRTARHEGGRSVPNLPLKVESGYERWEDNQARFIPTDTQTVTTGPDGTATLTITPPREGYFQVRATARDDRGNTIEASTYIWVAGGPGADFGRSLGKVTLQLDKPSYRVGDTAKVLIATQAQEASVLVTVEADRVYHRQVIPLQGFSTVIDLPIAAEYLPNAFVGVAFVSGKQFHEANRRLALDLSVRELTIDIATDKKIYAPGETARYTITTRNPEGLPVPANLSLALVDESIYAIREDATNPLEGYYPRRWNSVATQYSFPELYLGGGDKGESQIDIRTRFLDTAAWFPNLETDASGQAQVTIDLPDNLTQWRATAVGATAGTHVGMATQKVRVRKELMVRLQAPRFFTQSDESRAVAVLHNETDRPMEVEVALEAQGLSIEGKTTQRLSLPAGEPTEVAWRLTVPGYNPEAMLTVTAQQVGGRLNDGMQQRLPVLPHGRLMVDHTAGRAAGNPGTWDFTLHHGAIPGAGSLKLTLTPTLASSLINSLDYLIGYPYGCTEQTMSRFLPTVIVGQTLRELDLDRPEIAAQIPDMVAKGYARLQKMQHDDGGWGWWEYDESDPWMTAYVLEGYARAADAGYPPDERSRQRGIDWAKSYLDGGIESASRSYRGGEANPLFLLRALALLGEHEFVAQKISGRSSRDLTGSGQLVSAVLIYNALDFGPERDATLVRLVEAATDDALPHWEEEWWGVETTAQAILAIATIDPTHPILPGAIQWLELQRRGDHWYSTRDTAIALAGISQYLRATGELKPDYMVEVLLNGEVVQTVTFT
ncbi:MAG TPA: MG2 domain-containing protein, partial [bacterium]|nr:MG2 domain-containing protein [bacterium]